MGALCCSCLCPESSDRGVEMSNSNRIRILADAKLKGDNVKIKNGTSVEGSGSTYSLTQTHSNKNSPLERVKQLLWHLFRSNRMQHISRSGYFERVR